MKTMEAERTAAVRVALFVMSVALFSSVARAQGNERRLDLDQCIEVGLANNLRLQNEQIREELAVMDILEAESVYDTFLSLGGTHTDSEILDAGSSFASPEKEVTDVTAELSKGLPSGTRVGLTLRQTKLVVETNAFYQVPPYSSSASLSVSQSLWRNAFGSLNRAVVQRAKKGERIANGLYQREADLLALRITEAYWNLYASRANYEVGSTSLNLARELLATNKKREADGLLDETDVLSAEALIATRSADVLASSNRVAEASDHLARMIQVPVRERARVDFVYPTEEEMDVLRSESLAKDDDILRIAMQHRPDLTALITRVEQADIDLRIKKGALSPDLKLIGSVARGRSDTSSGESLAIDDPAWTVGIQFETSLDRSRERSEARRAELALQVAENNLADMKDAISQECRSVTRELVNARARVLATKQAAVLLEKRLTQEEKKFSQGRSDTRWVIQSQDELALSRASYYMALAEYYKVIAKRQVTMGLRPGRGTQ